MEYKVSVIIPIYNAATYLKMCVKSLMRQTLDEIEYIFINDASTDNSILILEDILKQYPNRRSYVINLQKNGGISNARNIGIRYATGEYITHCDSDDWIDSEMYATLYQLASESEADIAACDFIHEYETHNSISQQPYSTDMQDNMKRLLDGRIFPSLWASIIKRELITMHDISFPKDLNMGEDLLFNVKVYYYANTIVHTNSPYYHYRHTDGSVCIRRSKKSINSDIAIAGLIEEFLIKNDCYHIYKQEITYRKFFSKLALIRNFDNKKDYQEWLHIYPETHKKIFSYEQIEPKLRFMLWIASKHFFWISQLLKHLLKWQHTLRHKW